MTNQPVWKFIANLGDVSPIEYDGYFILEDETGVYPPEAEYWDADNRTAYRFSLDKLYMLTPEWEARTGRKINVDRPVLVEQDPARTDLPYDITAYIPWFDGSIGSTAKTAGMAPEELRRLFCSADTLERAQAYRYLGEHFGWSELDNYPLVLSKREAEKRYATWKNRRRTLTIDLHLTIETGAGDLTSKFYSAFKDRIESIMDFWSCKIINLHLTVKEDL